MNFTDESLQILARRLGEERVESREELEDLVRPLVHRVLRTGRGRSSIVRFVRQHLRVVAPASRFDAAVDAESATPRMARLLIAHMLRQIHIERAQVGVRETVVA